MKLQTALCISRISASSSRQLKLLLAILFCLSLAATAGIARGAEFVVTTTKGKVQGRAYGSRGAQFLGIPYAQPPVGSLRWRAPLAMQPWTGVRSATTFGAPCAQPDLGDWNRRDAAKSREDCLFVNVITPVWPPKGRLPVMFFIHGGANEGGTASSALYKDGTLPRHGILLVTINYRLGVFGFLPFPRSLSNQRTTAPEITDCWTRSRRFIGFTTTSPDSAAIQRTSASSVNPPGPWTRAR